MRSFDARATPWGPTDGVPVAWLILVSLSHVLGYRLRPVVLVRAQVRTSPHVLRLLGVDFHFFESCAVLEFFERSGRNLVGGGERATIFV